LFSEKLWKNSIATSQVLQCNNFFARRSFSYSGPIFHGVTDTILALNKKFWGAAPVALP